MLGKPANIVWTELCGVYANHTCRMCLFYPSALRALSLFWILRYVKKMSSLQKYVAQKKIHLFLIYIKCIIDSIDLVLTREQGVIKL